MCNQEETRSAILDWLVGQLSPVQLPELYGGFCAPMDCCLAPDDSIGIVAGLEAEFTEEQLEASGVMRRGEDDRLTLARSLGTPGSVIVALREGEGQALFELLTPSGGLVGRDVPILSSLRDYRTEKWLAKTGRRLFVGALPESIAAFWSVHLPAATLAGLTGLSGHELRELFQRLGWHGATTAEDRANEPEPIHLTFVNWQPETLSSAPSVDIRRVAEFMARVERLLDIDMSRCAVWSPSRSEVQDLAFCLDWEDLDATTEALLSSADSSSYCVSAYADPAFQPRREPADIREALAEIERCEEEQDENRRRRALARHEDLVDVQWVAPLIERAAESRDPLERNLNMVVAESVRLIHLQTPILRQSVSKLAKQPACQGDQDAVMAQLRNRERQIASLTKLIKASRE